MPEAAEPAPAGRAKRAVGAVFFVHALLFASWTAHIPQVKADLALDDAALGLALLGAPLGSVAAMLAMGWLLPRLGSRLVVRLTLGGYCLAGAGVGLADSPPWLFAALAGWGVLQGGLDVAMNTQAITVERAVGKPIMSGLHGRWSIGGFAGAAIGVAVVTAGVDLAPQLIVLGMLAGLAAGWNSRHLVPETEQSSARRRTGGSGVVLRRPILMVLGLTAFASMLCEGAAANWSAVYLRDSLAGSPAVAGLGYAVFSAAMLTMRLSGDSLLRRLPPRILLPALATVSTIGMGAALVVGRPVVALIGFAALGVGLACVVPTVFSAAGAVPGVDPGTAIAVVSALGWVGFVVGPPLIGHLAATASLPVALGLLPLLTTAIVVATRMNSALRQRAGMDA